MKQLMHYNVKVQFTVEDGKGKIKKQNVLYLVEAVSVSDAETIITQHLTDQGEKEFEVKSASESAVSAVVGLK